MNKRSLSFDNRLTKNQTIAGLCYLPMHYIILPLLMSLYVTYAPQKPDDVVVNLVYYAIGILFIMIFMRKFLRDGFDILLDRLGFCVITILLAYLIDYALSYLLLLVMTLLEDGILESAAANPNNNAVMQLAEINTGTIKGIAIFLAPIVEEVLFRGVVFGAIRKRSRIWAYVVSIVLFSVYHVWQYAIGGGGWGMLLYAIQYIPLSFILAWCYERTSSIWTSIFFHMSLNALSFYMLELLESLA